ncbi:heme biosynthesis protein HemY [Ciceribacter sp. L1K22]|uniref:heme biosynthesis protein HemY n=1 Tax=Ciceribacter sp. L1K22 TaxID=2820275 RepID=UPI001ABDA312|nr:heme biosynthesis protein HemY [Ciceribacter sp. L1K22]
MIRLLTFLLLVLALGFGFAWLADRPGQLSILWDGQLVEMSLTVAASFAVALVAAVMMTWWLVRTIWTSPHSVRRYFRARTRDRGYQALSTGLIAAGAGNAILARKMSARARGLLRADQEPLILMLDAQAALIEGKQDEARRLFQQMSEDPETRELGLRGLYVDASRLGANEAARQYAETATEQAPYLPWAAKATLEYRCQNGHWDDAIRLLDQQRIAHVLNRAEADRVKAVLLTAKAADQLDAEPTAARDNAVGALKLIKDFVPAALIAAKAYMREENLRKASSVLEQVWKLQPHPEIAAAYVRLRSGDSAVDRLKRAEKLEALKPNNPESLLAVSEAALAATEFGKARSKAEAALRMEPSERVFLLLADIEEAETGDQGRIRHWMVSALKAPKDAAWVADGHVSEKWLPVSPVTGRLDAFEWKVPFDQVGDVSDSHEKAKDAVASLPPVTVTEEAEPQVTVAPGALSPIDTESEMHVATTASPAPEETKEIAPPFFGRPPDDPGVRDPDRPASTKTRLPLF